MPIFMWIFVISAEDIGCTCHDFINHNGYGQCKLKDLYHGHVRDNFVCYVNQPSNCDDLYASVSNPGKKLSAIPCKKDGKALPNHDVISSNCRNEIIIAYWLIKYVAYFQKTKRIGIDVIIFQRMKKKHLILLMLSGKNLFVRVTLTVPGMRMNQKIQKSPPVHVVIYNPIVIK